MVSARRLSLLVAAALVTVFCLQLLLTHQKLAGVDYLEEHGRAQPGQQLRGIGGGAGHGQRRRAAAAASEQQQAGLAAGADAAQRLVPGRAGGLPNAAVLLFCYNRVGYLNQTLHSLAGLRGLERYTVYVSQDGDDQGVRQLLEGLAGTLFGRHGAGGRAQGFVHWMRPRVPQLGVKQPGSAWLAQHYGWALERVFSEHGHSHVVILEDDMLFSPDFLEYFEATAPLLDADPSLWCISSWNDNGFAAMHEWSPSRLFRTSYFPGLGWLMKRELWQELGPKWPKDHWDHWMRMEDVSRGRECVAPEVNRNKNIGEVGANMNKSAFKRYLAAMAWSAEEHVDFGDLAYLLNSTYSAAMREALARAERLELKPGRMVPNTEPGRTYLVTYVVEEYQLLAARLKLWPNPRGHHQYVASIPFKGARLLVADRRFCPLLPPDQRLRPTPGMRAVAAQRNQSCIAACEAAGGLWCRPADFWFVNTCSELKQHFPCERGCTVELGPDVPLYVMEPSSPGYHYCLITQRPSRCSATNSGAARLCPCSPPDAGGGDGRAVAEREERQLPGGRSERQSLLLKEVLAANRKMGVEHAVGAGERGAGRGGGGGQRGMRSIGDGWAVGQGGGDGGGKRSEGWRLAAAHGGSGGSAGSEDSAPYLFSRTEHL